MRNLPRDCQSELVEAVHRLTANLQDSLYGSAGLLIREVLLQAIAADKAKRRSGAILDVLEVDAKPGARWSQIARACALRNGGTVGRFPLGCLPSTGTQASELRWAVILPDQVLGNRAGPITTYQAVG